jgi:predicted enzyme related to lactoylglutathione lyase
MASAARNHVPPTQHAQACTATHRVIFVVPASAVGWQEATMGVTGIGGFFFRAKDPEAMRAWYVEHLGVGSAPYGSWETQAGPSVFAPFAADTDYFAADRQWMLNLRVDDLDGLCTTLRAAGIEVTTNPEWNMPGIGRFARIHDPEGNPVELWQPDQPA